MKKLTSTVLAAAPAIARDAIGTAGAGLIVAGVALLSVPAAMILTGVMLVTICLAWARGA